MATDYRDRSIKRSWRSEIEERERDRFDAKKKSARDIAPLVGEPVNPERRKQGMESLEFFLKTYFADTFALPFADFHHDIISTIETSIKRGENFCLACPRSSGKTSIVKGAVLWSIVTGLSKFSVLVAVSATRAAEILKDLIKSLMFNETLLEDFPEICVPFRLSEGNSRKFKSLTYDGMPCNAVLTNDTITFPLIPGKESSEAILKSTGLCGSGLRGLSMTTSKGTIRPQLVILDDPQDRESARSISQTEQREQIIQADIAGMAGVGQTFSLLCTCTVIEKDDLADRLLNPEMHPEFKGKKFSLLPTMPSPAALELWRTYKDIRASEFRNNGDGSQARQFYIDNHDAMSEGATVSWPERKGREDVDALEYAMKLLLFQGEQAFFSEYQNCPVARDELAYAISLDTMRDLSDGSARGVAPSEADDFITAFIDCHKNLLYYTIVAFSTTFQGRIIDYGTYPRQARRDFEQKNASPNILSTHPGESFELAFTHALDELIEDLFTRTYNTDGGATCKLSRLLVDANWGETTDLVYNVIRRSPFNASILPSHGIYIGAKTSPFVVKVGPNNRFGDEWAIPKKTRAGQKYCLYNTNYWKSFLINRLTSVELSRRITIFGEGHEHYLLTKHLRAETPVTIEAKGRRLDEWVTNSNKDNHWFDCLVGCCVGASINGAKLLAIGEASVLSRRERLIKANAARMKKGL